MLALSLVIALDVTGAANAKVAADLATARDYAQLEREVLAWHHTRRNACTAFASTALRDAGVDVPHGGVEDGYDPSRITLALAHFLEGAGWVRIDDPARLAAGDVIFTADDPCCEGFPEHVMIFDGWRDRTKQIARVIDNQGYRYARPLRGARGYSAFHFALRDAAPREIPR